MKIKTIDVKADKNNDLYLKITYVSSKDKECKICLNHYDLEYAIKGKIKYDVKTKNNSSSSK